MKSAVVRGVEPRKPRARTQHRVDAPVLVVEDGVTKVRILDENRTLTGSYRGGGLTKEHSVTLGGRVIERIVDTKGNTVEGGETMAPARQAIAAARTRDTIDFGRFMDAVGAFCAMVEKAGAEPSPEQQEEILRSYQGLLAWHEALMAAVTRADGALEIATRKVRSAF